MALVTCPECAHEVSAVAAACPNCGHPFAPPVVQRKVVVTEAPQRDDFPKWIFIPLGLLGVVLLFALIAFMRNNDDDGRNITVNVNTQRPAGGSLESEKVTTTSSIPSQSSTVVVPPSSASVPPMSTTTTTTTAPAMPSSQTTIPGAPAATITAPAPDKGTVTLDAKIQTNSGGVQPVKAERFYLLDKDLDSILSELDIENDTGQTLITAYATTLVYPNRYPAIKTNVEKAIAKHIIYRAQTDGSGKASMKDVKPDGYYLYGITKTGTGFAVWSSPVNINAGQNELNLAPARLTEISAQ